MMEPEASKPADLNREYVQKLLNGCLKHGLSALCKEKPEEPIKWLAHWLLENNPHQPRVRPPSHSTRCVRGIMRAVSLPLPRHGVRAGLD